MPETPQQPHRPELPDEPTPSRQGGKGLFQRFLDGVEWLGNLLPHPVTLFAIICVGILVLSGIAGALEWQVTDPRPEGANGRSPDGVIRAISLLNPEGLRRVSMGLVTNFTSFAPLGTVLVALLGVGVAAMAAGVIWGVVELGSGSEVAFGPGRVDVRGTF